MSIKSQGQILNSLKLNQCRVATESAVTNVHAKNQFSLHCSGKFAIPPNQVKIFFPSLQYSMQNKLSL